MTLTPHPLLVPRSKNRVELYIGVLCIFDSAGVVCISQCVTVAVIVFGTVMQKESCELAWDLLVGRYGLDPSRLYVTYFGGDRDLGLGPDLETRDIWRQIG
jgi:hypothetical protein